MIPSLVNLPGSPWPVLPPGIHSANLDEVGSVFATNPKRRKLYIGFVDASNQLRLAGCTMVYLDGSFVTGKPNPRDFDGCWEPSGINISQLNPVFLEFDNSRKSQKAEFGGEFFPVIKGKGQSFVDFFQKDRFSGMQKGIISILLQSDPLLVRGIQP